MTTITVEKLQTLAQSNEPHRLLDVRSPGEFKAQHVPFAENLPLDQISKDTLPAELPKDEPVYLICETGGRSAKAVSLLQNLGFSKATTVLGGTQAWKKAGYPTTDSQNTISLERQVRITAGTLVAISSALTYLVNPAFILIPAIIGTGLVFAGITNSCSMGMLLLKMPWNR